MTFTATSAKHCPGPTGAKDFADVCSNNSLPCTGSSHHFSLVSCVWFLDILLWTPSSLNNLTWSGRSSPHHISHKHATKALQVTHGCSCLSSCCWVSQHLLSLSLRSHRNAWMPSQKLRHWRKRKGTTARLANARGCARPRS